MNGPVSLSPTTNPGKFFTSPSTGYRFKMSERISALLDRKDHTDSAIRLSSHPDIFWKSTTMEDYLKSKGVQKGAIHFLRMTNDGIIILDVFRPGVHSTCTLDIEPSLAATMRTYLRKNTHSERMLQGHYYRKDVNGPLAEQSMPHALHIFTQKIRISPTHTLVWKGRHRNPKVEGGAFVIEQNTLEIRSM